MKRDAPVAIGIRFDQGDYLFFDPFSFDGIHLGAIPSRDLWASRFGAGYHFHSLP